MRNLIKKILKESDFDWIEDIKPNQYDGIIFDCPDCRGDGPLYTIVDKGGPEILITWANGTGFVNYKREDVERYLNNGTWEVVDRV